MLRHMIQMVVISFLEMVASGHRHLSQAADAVLDETEEVKGKPGSEKSSGHRLVDCGEESDSVVMYKTSDCMGE